MSWMLGSQTPAGRALRDLSWKPPIPLWGPRAKPRSLKQAGRRAGGAKMGIAFANRLTFSKPERGAA